MKRIFSLAAALTVPVMAGSLGLIACDPPIVPTETVRNDLVDTSTTMPAAVPIASIELRLLGEQDDDITELPGGDSFPITLNGIQGGTIGAACTSDADCGEGSTCVSGTGDDDTPAASLCFTPANVDVSAVDCGTYEVRVNGMNGGSCEFTIPRPMGETCTTRTDCPGGLDCVDGACAFRQYRGNGFYICFEAGRWDLTAHLSSDNCAAIYPNIPSDG